MRSWITARPGPAMAAERILPGLRTWAWRGGFSRGRGGGGAAGSFGGVGVSPPAPRRIQHDLHQARCCCGKVDVAGRPAGVPDSAVSIGPNLRALAVYLVVFQHVPIERCAQLIADVTGAQVSAGFVHSCLAK